MADGPRDEPVSTTREETAGVEQFDQRFAWTPDGRPVSLLVYGIAAAPYLIVGVVVMAVIALIATNAGAVAAIGNVSAPDAPEFDFDFPDINPNIDPGDLNPFAGDKGADATPTPTGANLDTPTATDTDTASATPSPTPPPTSTATPTPTPTDRGVSPTPTSDGTPTATPTPTPTATPTHTPTPAPTPTATPTPTPEPGEPFLAVTIDSTNSPVAEGDPLDVTATIENTGGTEAEQTIILNIDGSQKDSTTVTLAPGESTQTTLTWSTSSGDAGDYTAEVVSENDTASTGVSVRQPPEITQFDTSASCGILTEDALLEVQWDTSNANDVLVQITDPDGNVIYESTDKSGDSGTVEDTGGCGNDYTFTIEASNSVGSTSDSTTKTAG